MSYVPSLPNKATLLDVFKANPEISIELIEFHEALLRGSSPFSEAERELIAAYVSGLNECRYCRAVHTATVERLGAAKGLVDQLIDDIDTAPVEQRMKPVLRYAKKLTMQPTCVTQADADAVFAAGWDESALYHAVFVIALFNLMNRLVEGLGIELDPAYAESAGDGLANRGYAPLIHMIKSAARAGSG